MAHIVYKSDWLNGGDYFYENDTVDGGISRDDESWEVVGGGFTVTRGASLRVINNAFSTDGNGDPVGWAVQGHVTNVPSGEFDIRVKVWAAFLVPDETD